MDKKYLKYKLRFVGWTLAHVKALQGVYFIFLGYFFLFTCKQKKAAKLQHEVKTGIISDPDKCVSTQEKKTLLTLWLQGTYINSLFTNAPNRFAFCGANAFAGVPASVKCFISRNDRWNILRFQIGISNKDIILKLINRQIKER